jgi:hypothetical protein
MGGAAASARPSTASGRGSPASGSSGCCATRAASIPPRRCPTPISPRTRRDTWPPTWRSSADARRAPPGPRGRGRRARGGLHGRGLARGGRAWRGRPLRGRGLAGAGRLPALDARAARPPLQHVSHAPLPVPARHRRLPRGHAGGAAVRRLPRRARRLRHRSRGELPRLPPGLTRPSSAGAPAGRRFLSARSGRRDTLRAPTRGTTRP